MRLAKCPVQDKDCYPTARMAIKVALKRSRRSGTPLRYYFHRACGSFHLTKTERRVAVAC